MNRLSTPCPDSGLMMNMCAVAGLCSASMFGICVGGVVDLGKRGGEPHRLADDARAEIVGGVFARAADRHLHQHCAEWSQDHHRDRSDQAGPVVAAIAAEEHAELRQHRDRAGDGRGNRHQ